MIFGHISLTQIRSSDGALKGREMAIAGLVVNYLVSAMWIAFIVTIAAGEPHRAHRSPKDRPRSASHSVMPALDAEVKAALDSTP